MMLHNTYMEIDAPKSHTFCLYHFYYRNLASFGFTYQTQSVLNKEFSWADLDPCAGYHTNPHWSSPCTEEDWQRSRQGEHTRYIRTRVRSVQGILQGYRGSRSRGHIWRHLVIQTGPSPYVWVERQPRSEKTWSQHHHGKRSWMPISRFHSRSIH